MSKDVLKIGLIDADRLDNKTRHPNLALMKISAYCKSKNHSTRLIFDIDEKNWMSLYDILIISKVFTFTSIPQEIAKLLPNDNDKLQSYNLCIVDLLSNKQLKNTKQPILAIGGTGFFDDGGRDLHEDIEHIMPDYHLYDEFVEWMVNVKGIERKYFDDYENYSIGFTTRGCFRKCPFCVNKKYNKCKNHASISEFFDKERDKIYLWDDNFLANPSWNEILDELDATGKQFQFRQGLDLRLMTEKKAERISRSRCYGDTIFAFDNVDDYDLIANRLARWRKYSRRTTKLYVLCAFDSWLDPNRTIRPEQKHLLKMYDLETQDERDQLDIEGIFIRIELLMRNGCLPYIMRYERYKESKYRELYIQIARWCNQPQFYKKKSFAEFCKANQDYAKSDNICASYRALLDFEKERPDIVKRYFHMRFDKLDSSRVISSFGRQDTIPCIYCNNTGGWDSTNAKKLISGYYSGNLNQLCILCRPKIPCIKNQCTIEESKLGKILLDVLFEANYTDIINSIDTICPELSRDLIPQPNDIDNALLETLDLIDEPGLSFRTIGERCTKSLADTKGSNSKYGESQTKLLMMMDLVWKDRTGLRLTPLGEEVQQLSSDERQQLFPKLLLKVPFIQYLLIVAKDRDYIYLEEVMSDLSPSTIRRRLSPINRMLNKIKGCNPEIDTRLNKIKLSRNN